MDGRSDLLLNPDRKDAGPIRRLRLEHLVFVVNSLILLTLIYLASVMASIASTIDKMHSEMKFEDPANSETLCAPRHQLPPAWPSISVTHSVWSRLLSQARWRRSLKMASPMACLKAQRRSPATSPIHSA